MAAHFVAGRVAFGETAARQEVEIGATDSAGLDADADLARARFGARALSEADAAPCVDDGGAHGLHGP